MTPRLTRLRIAGFKSFAEPASLDILPGLTGIVGPNGCGKSNVVEALRWAMGETSARSLRGGEMDDVIFAGTTARASRNLAEVTVTLDAAGSTLPAPFEAEAELQVTRRIERGAGSAFRANGRELRARDVQTLYADLASGARSSGMVSQGRVSALVNGRPEERRQVLEEAAGITGLHARRHEAELKLRAAEQNLARAEDLRGQLDSAREGLRKQARQAARYRNISGLIRAAEAEHIGVLHAQAEAVLAQAREELALAERALDAAVAQEAEAVATLADAEAALPAPRREEAEARGLLERRRLEDETLSAEASRVAREAEEAGARLRDLDADHAEASQACLDASTSLTRLGQDRDRHAARLEAMPAETAGAAARIDAARDARCAAQEAADEAARLHASAEAAARRAGEVHEAAAARLAAQQTRHAEIHREHDACVAALVSEAALARSAAALAQAEAALDAGRSAFQAAETARTGASAAALAAKSRAERDRQAYQAAAELAEAALARADRLDAAHREAEAAVNGHLASIPDPSLVAEAFAASDLAGTALAEAEACIDEAERSASEARASAAAAREAVEAQSAGRARAAATRQAAASRTARLAAELHEARQALTAACEAAPLQADIDASAAASDRAARDEEHHAAALEDAHQARAAASNEAAAARSLASSAEARVAFLAAEADGLAQTIGDEAGHAEALAALIVPDGLERAVSAALGEAGSASLDPGDDSSPQAWLRLPEMPAPPMPAGSICLATLLDLPAALGRAMSHVALLGDEADGALVQRTLPPGMIAVDRAGASWRWDGHVTRAGAASPAANRLALRRRLAETRAHLDRERQAAIDARRASEDLDSRETATYAEEAARRGALEAARAALRNAGDALARVQAAQMRAAERRTALEPVIDRLEAEHRAALAEAEAAGQALAALPSLDKLQASSEAASLAAEAASSSLEAAREARSTARLLAQQAATAAQDLARAAERAVLMAESAQAALARAAAESQAARQAAANEAAARDALPAPSIAAAASSEADDREATCRAAEAAAREERQAAESALDGARRDDAALRAAHMQAGSRAAAMRDLLQRSQADLDIAVRQVSQAEAALAALPDVAALLEASQMARAALETARQDAGEAEARAAALATEQEHAARALAGLHGELSAWQARHDGAAARRDALAARCQAARIAWSALVPLPAETAARAGRSGEALAEAKANHQAAAGALAAAEKHLRDAAIAQRECAAAAGTARERRMRGEAAVEAAASALHAVLARAAERLGKAAEIPSAVDVSPAAEERARRKFERLGRERDEMGPVNLRAEIELDEIDSRVATLDQERDELGNAIAKLRGAIGHLNREGRERLSAVFNEVDRHFRTLFTRMMGGGQAHLALTGSDDPLLAGLEIYAEPPGKKLAALSLLSGGEQALTALSLIFAVFRCTPAPVCVLDEVDAPLDDANVERFCTLLDDVVRETGTSFLVVTHHQLTMSRMDRLFGVTMQERGVSRLLSVDLQRASAMVEAAMAGPVMQAAE